MVAVGGRRFGSRLGEEVDDEAVEFKLEVASPREKPTWS